MKVYVELMFPLGGSSRTMVAACQAFAELAHRVSESILFLVDIRAGKSDSEEVCVTYQLASTNALEAALRLGESFKTLPEIVSGFDFDVSVLRKSLLRVWLQKSNPNESEYLRRIHSPVEVQSKPTKHVEQPIRAAISQDRQDIVDSMESEKSLFVESFMVDLSVEQQDPIILMKSHPEFRLTMIPVLNIPKLGCFDFGLQTDDTLSWREFKNQSVQIGSSVVDDIPTVTMINTDPIIEQTSQSPKSIRPIRKQGKDLWDDD